MFTLQQFFIFDQLPIQRNPPSQSMKRLDQTINTSSTFLSSII